MQAMIHVLLGRYSLSKTAITFSTKLIMK